MITDNLLVSIVVLALAVSQVVAVWREGSIFAGWRAHTECWLVGPPAVSRFQQWLAELLGCQFCLSVWVSAVLSPWWFLPVSFWFKLPIVILAASNAASSYYAWRQQFGGGAGSPFILRDSEQSWTDTVAEERRLMEVESKSAFAGLATNPDGVIDEPRPTPDAPAQCPATRGGCRPAAVQPGCAAEIGTGQQRDTQQAS